MNYTCPSCNQFTLVIVHCKDGGNKYCSLCNEPFHIDKTGGIDVHKGFVHQCGCTPKIQLNYTNVTCPECNNVFDSNPKLKHLHCPDCNVAFFKSYVIY